MKITNVKIKKIESTTRVKAIASIELDQCFVVTDIKLLQDSESNDMFIAMPSVRQENGTFKDIAHPINSIVRNYITEELLKAYNNID